MLPFKFVHCSLWLVHIFPICKLYLFTFLYTFINTACLWQLSCDSSFVLSMFCDYTENKIICNRSCCKLKLYFKLFLCSRWVLRTNVTFDTLWIFFWSLVNMWCACVLLTQFIQSDLFWSLLHWINRMIQWNAFKLRAAPNNWLSVWFINRIFSWLAFFF